MFGKLAVATFPDQNKSGIESKIAMTSNCNAQQPNV
jgi:hypothetical protein